MVAIYSTVNAVCRNGLQAELGTSAALLPGVPGDPSLPHRLFYHPYAS